MHLFGSVNLAAFCFLIASSAIVSCGGSSDQDTMPVATNDAYSIAAGISLKVPAPGVLSNDQNLVGDNVSAELVSVPSNGTLTFNPDGSFQYAPHSNFSGFDYFSYKVSDGVNASNVVNVNITFPNVIFMIIDDMGQGESKIYNPDSAIQMPNLEKLANSGIRFAQAHSSAALCSPTRYSLMTGNYPYRGRNSAGVWESFQASTMILPDQMTLGNIFQSAGYQTAFIGKLHNGGAFWNRDGSGYASNYAEIDFTRPFDRGPIEFGFDYSFVLPAGLSAPPYAFFENDQLVRLDENTGQYEEFTTNSDAIDHLVLAEVDQQAFNGGLIGTRGIAIDNYDSRKVGPAITAKAIEFIDKVVKNNESLSVPMPWFLYFAPPQAHSPWTPPRFFNIAAPDTVDRNLSGIRVADQTPISNRTDDIFEMDVMLGLLVEHLRKRGQLSNTLIVFTSDNGAPVASAQVGYDGTGERIDTGIRSSAVHRNPQGVENGTPLRGFKGQVYEGGHRVPLVVRWGDGTTGGSLIKPRTTSDELIGLHDFAATFYALLGMEHPANQANDSVNLLPVILGSHSGVNPPRQHMIVQASAESIGNTTRMDRAFYSFDSNGHLWKLVANSSANDPESGVIWESLFNLHNDPGEMNNLIDDPQAHGLLSTMQTGFLELIALPRTIYL